MSQSDFLFPFRPGDWVMNQSGRVAKVKAVEEYRDEVTFDLVLYSSRGEKIGRESPSLGGPRTFEPSCSIAGWERCKKPVFPLQPKWVPQEDGSVRAMYWSDRLPPANYRKPMRKGGGAALVAIENALLRQALELIADGHNDARALARKTLRRGHAHG